MATIATTARAEYSLLELCLPGRAPEVGGVLLHDPQAGRLHVRLRRDWLEIAGVEYYEVLSQLEGELEAMASDWGAAEFFRRMEDQLSHTVRLTERESVLVHSFPATLDRLYRKHVVTHVLRYETHLPKYSLQAAAGSFSVEQDVGDLATHGAGDWLEMPPDLRLEEDLFVAQVTGRSMEPLIADGSWCVFRWNVAGSRNGRMVLARKSGSAGDLVAQFSVKRYRSAKTIGEEGYAHTRIWLEPLNPEFEPWDVEPDGRVSIIAEFVRALAWEPGDVETID